MMSDLNLAAAALVVLGPMVVYPLFQLLRLSVTGESGFDASAFIAFFTSSGSWRLVFATLGVVAESPSIASVIGIALAAALFFFPLPGSSLLIRFLELFVAFSSFLVAFALIFLSVTQGAASILLMELFGLAHPPRDFLFGAGGVVLAEVMIYTPFVVRPTLAAFALLDGRLIEAASSLCAPPAMVARRVVFPLALPGITAGVILCFLLTLNEFGILLVLGSANLITLPVAIYSAATVDFDLHTAAALAVVMLFLSLGLHILYRLADRRAPVLAR